MIDFRGVVIFAVTYALISARRLGWLGFDRPAGALLGAVACVVAGVLTPQMAADAVDTDTLLLLFGMMGLGAFLAIDGFFDDVAIVAVRVATTPARLLGLVVWGAGILSALITNDAVCVLGAPLVVSLIKRHRLPALPFLLALATGANTGSVATLVGNPQNMLCASLGGLAYRDHLLLVGPVAVVALLINHLLLRWSFRRVLASATLNTDSPPSTTTASPGRARISLVVIAGTAVAATLGAHLAWTAVTGLVVLLLLHRRDSRQIWVRIDWSVLLFFVGLFIVVAGFVHSGAPAAFFARFPLAPAPDISAVADGGSWGSWLRLGGIFLAGSNLVSNVPFILVVEQQLHSLPNPRLAWELLAVVSTFAGNLTLLGSVANIIVAEAGRDVGGMGFVDYAKIGVPLAVITSALGVFWLVAVG
jgi:Na+/H+ antiporter NhaD/arsenite permease-like protein